MQKLVGLHDNFDEALKSIEQRILEAQIRLEKTDEEIENNRILGETCKRNIRILENSEAFLEKERKGLNKEFRLEFKILFVFLAILELGTGVLFSVLMKSLHPMMIVLKLALQYHYLPVGVFGVGYFLVRYHDIVKEIREVKRDEEKNQEWENLRQIFLEEGNLREERLKVQSVLGELEEIRDRLNERMMELNQVVLTIIHQEEEMVIEEKEMSRR